MTKTGFVGSVTSIAIHLALVFFVELKETIVLFKKSSGTISMELY